MLPSHLCFRPVLTSTFAYWPWSVEITQNPAEQRCGWGARKSHTLISRQKQSKLMEHKNTDIFIRPGVARGNLICPSLLSLGRYPALSWQSPMNAMCWPGSEISHGKVFIHHTVLCLLRQVERICREGCPNSLCISFQRVLEYKALLAQQDRWRPYR